MTSLEYFRLFAPEYADVPDATVNKWLAMASAMTDTSCLSAELAAMAQALYAAHLLTLSKQASYSSGASGTIKREKEGDLEREYAVGKVNGTSVDSTSYGQQYLDITAACHGAGIMTRMQW